MRHDALSSLRHALLLSLGIGGCNPRTPAATGADGVDPAPVPTVPAATPAPAPAVEPAIVGYVREADGTVHRASAQQCTHRNTKPACKIRNVRNTSCFSDDDCTEDRFGRCVDTVHVGGEMICDCEYSCTADSDCAPGSVCVCGEFLGEGHPSTCVPATCKSDSQCASGVCGLSQYHNGCREMLAMACRTPDDECRSALDCGEFQSCVTDLHSGSGKWHCDSMRCKLGRPLIVDGVARAAASVDHEDWTELLDLPALTGPVAEALAAHWSEIAALEHASVASFARFTVELMAFGAPAELLAEAQRAALDEIHHARLGWSLAGLWSGRTLGPGPLTTGEIGQRGLAEFVAALVYEGCIGETLAAAEAGLLAELADPRLAWRLARVAADETRHAALAWRTLGWLHRRFGEAVAIAAHATLEAFRAELRRADPPTAEVLAPAWGLVAESSLLAHQRATFSAVTVPLMTAVLAGAQADARVA